MTRSIARNAFFVTVLTVLIATLCARAEGVWTEDFPAAQAQAAREGKDLLLDFTGSDWCGWCKKLKAEVFDQDAFKNEAVKNFVLVELDFPRGKLLPESVKTQNKGLEERYRNSINGYPTILLADSKGRVYAYTWYHEGGAEPYLKHLAELREQKKFRDEMLAKADQVKGLERAGVLDELLMYFIRKGESAPGGHNIAGEYADLMEEVIDLDGKDRVGLKTKYGEYLKTLKAAGRAARAKVETPEKPAAGGSVELDAEKNKVYHNPATGLSLTFPPDWEVNAAVDGKSVKGTSAKEENDDFVEYVEVNVSETDGAAGLADLYPRYLNGLRQAVAGFKIVSEADATVDGNAARKLVFTSGENAQRALYYFLKEKRLFAVSCWSTRSSFERFTETFDWILESVKTGEDGAK